MNYSKLSIKETGDSAQSAYKKKLERFPGKSGCLKTARKKPERFPGKSSCLEKKLERPGGRPRKSPKPIYNMWLLGIPCHSLPPTKTTPEREFLDRGGLGRVPGCLIKKTGAGAGEAPVFLDNLLYMTTYQVTSRGSQREVRLT